MSVPVLQAAKVGAYIMKQKMAGNKKYPLVLMLEPLFRCNLACAGCGKIDYPDDILNKRLSVDQCLEAVDECGAPVVAIPGGEPLIHKDIGKIVQGIIDRGKFVNLCTNALLLEKKIDLFTPSPYLTFSVHLDGLEKEHDHAVCQEGVFDKAVAAIRAVKAKGFNVAINTTLFNDADPKRVADFFDFVATLKIDGVTVSPGYAYERAPDQQHFLNRRQTKELFREVFRLGKERGSKWSFKQSSLFIDFLAGNQTFECSAWSMPTRNIFGWQKPCYLLGEGYVDSYAELMATTNWDQYGVGKYEKCANCMVHCGFEGTAVNATFAHPIKAAKVALFGPNVDGDFAPELPLHNARPAEYVFSSHVEKALAELHTEAEARKSDQKAA